MWLLPAFAFIASIAARVYYRLTIDGDAVPRDEPVLLVANHPNSLLDPVLVAAAARRPVRFLAKAPLFKDWKVGWIVRASGAIPIYRRVDNPAAMNQNTEMFRAVVEALTRRDAVGIFPEGLSHSEPAMAQLKTGAARIALATAAAGTNVRIAPIGIILRDKDRFRSEAHVVIGKPIEWTDLAARDPEDRDAVEELTDLIGVSLRSVTLNLEAWADEPLVACTEAIWAAEYGGKEDLVSRVARLRVTTELLAHHRRVHGEQTAGLASAIVTHHQRLSRLRMSPRDLTIDTSSKRNLIWAARRFYFDGLPAIVVGLIGGAAFWIPFQITAKLSRMARLPEDQRSTFNMLVGALVYAIWTLTIAGIVAWSTSVISGIATALTLPLLGLVGMLVRERWRGAWQDVRRYLTLRSRRELLDALARRQRNLAAELKRLSIQESQS